jgi:hypothetical protein
MKESVDKKKSERHGVADCIDHIRNQFNALPEKSSEV